MLAIVSSKGQITIPASIRKLLQLKTGDAVDFVFTDPERVELVPVRTPVQALRGIIQTPSKIVSLEEMEAAIGRGGEK